MVHKNYSIQGKAWYTDQIKLRKYVNKFSRKNKSRIVELNDEELGFIGLIEIDLRNTLH